MRKSIYLSFERMRKNKAGDISWNSIQHKLLLSHKGKSFYIIFTVQLEISTYREKEKFPVNIYKRKKNKNKNWKHKKITLLLTDVKFYKNSSTA